MKFFTIGLFFLVFSNFISAQGIQVIKTKNGAKTNIPLNQYIEFTLFSDSILEIEFVDDASILSYTDSSLVLNDEREILLTDFKSIRTFPAPKRKAKAYAVSFLMAGIGFLTKGIVMASGEGLKSKNKTTAPLFIAGGVVATSLSSIPFWDRKKNYNFDRSKWTLSVE